MEESKEQQSLHRFLQSCIYISVALEIVLFVYAPKMSGVAGKSDHDLSYFLHRLSRILIYHQPLYTKFFTLFLICLVAIGTLSKKNKDLNPKNSILYPLVCGLIVMMSGLYFYGKGGAFLFYQTSANDIGYIFCAITGTVLVHVAMDNVSKIISTNFGKDKWNVEGESFMQPTKPNSSLYAVNIPTLFYYKRKVREGYLTLDNVCKGTLICGVPGSGKSFGLILPILRSLIAKSFSIALYDFKFPDLAKVAYYHYLLAKQAGKIPDHKFHVINLTQLELSERVNVMRPDYIVTLADASETAEGLVEALKKGDKSGGSDQFFTQSAVNFLAACIYFVSQHQKGRYSTFAHVLSFLNCTYEEIFSTLFTNKELTSLLSPFMTAYKAKAFDQLEGQVGTLKIFISRLATKESYWVFSGDDFDLKISDPAHPAILVLANDPNTQNINSACYSVVLNRLTRLINSKGNLPCGLIIDEIPTLYVHRIENLLATARSNLVAVVMGLQELPQFKQQYGKDTAATITAVVGNVISGAVRNKETLEWLERLFGKVKQVGESLSIDRNKTSVSLNEKLEPLIPAGKIASLKTGEMVGMLANDAVDDYTGKYDTSAVNCRISLDMRAIKKEEQAYRPMPVFYDFKGKKDEVLRANFFRISREVQEMVREFKPISAPQPGPQSKGSMRPGFKN